MEIDWDNQDPEEGNDELSVIISVKGVPRVYKGDYDTLYNNDWTELVRDQIDNLR